MDNLPTSPGDAGKLGVRNSPTVIYASLHTMQFWDGRAKDVEAQAEGPILNPVEHNIPSAEFLENRLREIPSSIKNYLKRLFLMMLNQLHFKNIANAIGAFERQFNPVSRFDKYLDGDDSALTQQEKDGCKLILTQDVSLATQELQLAGKCSKNLGYLMNIRNTQNPKKWI